jgi:hypothetical protein
MADISFQKDWLPRVMAEEDDPEDFSSFTSSALMVDHPS